MLGLTFLILLGGVIAVTMVLFGYGFLKLIGIIPEDEE